MSRDNGLTQYRRQRSHATGLQQVAMALFAVAAIVCLGLVLWQVAGIFEVLVDHLPRVED